MTAEAGGAPADLDQLRAALGGDYDMLEEIGRGGMAVVYRARERALDREVAIKILPVQFAFDEGFIERFQREGRIAAGLEHPHIVPIYRVGRSGQIIYLVMKLLRGQSLSARIREQGRLPASEVRRVLLETASALGYAAKRGIVHRDVKPDNIMLDDDGRCIVTDFGIARSAADSRLTATGMSVGTPRYMSPEQARARPLDGRSDLYSLGVVGYECLVGTTPFDGEDAFAILMKHIRTPVPRPTLRTDEEWEVFGVIDRMLAKEPDDRYQTADEVTAALWMRQSAARPGAPSSPRTEGTSPTRPLAAVGHGESGPRPSEALDRALDIGVELVRQQKTRLEAGVRAFRARQAGAAGPERADPGAAQRPGIGGLADGVTRALRERLTYLTSRGRGFWGAVGGAVVGLVMVYYAAHFLTKHRSRCPLGTPAPAVTRASGDSAAIAPAKAPAFSVLVDAIGTTRPGGDLDVYYDVCGLEAGTTYAATVTVARNESGLRKMFGGSVGPITVSYDETAGGPAVRRHRTIDFEDRPPGSYSLNVAVVDGKGRRRQRGVSFQVSAR